RVARAGSVFGGERPAGARVTAMSGRVAPWRKPEPPRRHKARRSVLYKRAGCKISSLAGGREQGRPAGGGAVGRDQCFSGEHPVGLFADRTRLELILQRTQRVFVSSCRRGSSRMVNG